MDQSPGSVEARIVMLLAEARRLLESGRVAQALSRQRAAVDEARRLTVLLPKDMRLRQGLASVLYNYASILVSCGDPATAVPALDECLGLYLSLVGVVPNGELLCADVRARRGLALGTLGRAASAAADTDAAVVAYLTATEGDVDHPLGRDVARVLCMNAAVLARSGDPGLALVSADAALAYYLRAAELQPTGQLLAEDGGYLCSAASVSAMFHLAAGRLADGFYAAEVVASSVEPARFTESLSREMGMVQRLLARSAQVGHPVPNPLDLGRMLAAALLPVLRGTSVLWLPPGEPGPGQPGDSGWPGWEIQPTLEEALARRAVGSADADLGEALAPGQPRELVFSASMRWPGQRLERGARLAQLAVKVLPDAYEDGLRLALDAHVLLTSGQRSEVGAAGRDVHLLHQRLLERAAAACRAAGDAALGEDLADLEANLHSAAQL